MIWCQTCAAVPRTTCRVPGDPGQAWHGERAARAGATASRGRHRRQQHRRARPGNPAAGAEPSMERHNMALFTPVGPRARRRHSEAGRVSLGIIGGFPQHEADVAPPMVPRPTRQITHQKPRKSGVSRASHPPTADQMTLQSRRPSKLRNCRWSSNRTVRHHGLVWRPPTESIITTSDVANLKVHWTGWFLQSGVCRGPSAEPWLGAVRVRPGWVGWDAQVGQVHILTGSPPDGLVPGPDQMAGRRDLLLPTGPLGILVGVGDGVGIATFRGNAT